jgi:AcrR family transcriptional regulator
MLPQHGAPVSSTSNRSAELRKRRTQQERSDEMRRRLSQAAYQVIAERGHSAFRVAAVAERAGVSQGAQLHHFATKESLTLAALEYALAHASERTADLMAHGLDADADPIALMIDDFRLFFMGDDFWVALDITIDGSRNAEFSTEVRPLVSRYRAPVYARWVAILSENGWDRTAAERIVLVTSAMVSGLGMRSLWDDVASYLPAVLEDWRGAVAALWPREPLGSHNPQG